MATSQRWRRAQLHRQVRPWDKLLNADKNLSFEKQYKLWSINCERIFIWRGDDQKELLN
jgi:hypothetical protein